MDRQVSYSVRRDTVRSDRMVFSFMNTESITDSVCIVIKKCHLYGDLMSSMTTKTLFLILWNVSTVNIVNNGYIISAHLYY